MKNKRQIAALLVAFAASRIVIFWQDHDDYLNRLPAQDDAPAYIKMAQIFRGETTYEAQELSPFTRVPLYPLFLAGMQEINESGYIGAVFVCQQIMLFGLVVIVFRQVRAKHSEGVALAMGLGLILFFDFTLYGYLIRSETLFTLLVVPAVLLSRNLGTKGGYGFAAGVGGMLGFATLTRPIAFLSPAVAIVLLLARWRNEEEVRRKLALSAIVLLMTFGAVLSPWLMRNYLLSGRLVLQQDTGNIIYATFPGGHWQASDVGGLVEKEGKTELEIDRELTAKAWKRIKDRPDIWIKNTLKNFLFRLWSMGYADTYLRYLKYTDDTGNYHKTLDGPFIRLWNSFRLGSDKYEIPVWYHGYFLANNILGFSMIGWSLLALVIWPALEKDRQIIFFWLGYFWMFTSFFAFSGSRYMIPMVPLLFILIPDLVKVLTDAVRKKMGLVMRPTAGLDG